VTVLAARARTSSARVISGYVLSPARTTTALTDSKAAMASVFLTGFSFDLMDHH
jgi:hypothetical protein